jgi:hypothetical protein
MRLTTPAVQYGTIIAAVVATFAALLLWNRVRGPLAARVLERCALLIGSYVATAVAVLVSVNIAYGGLIVSVGDLFGDPNAAPVSAHSHSYHHPVGR